MGGALEPATARDFAIALLIGALIVLIYTVLGGFRAVCWTDFLQALLDVMKLRLEDPLNLDPEYHKNIENFQATYRFQDQKSHIETVVTFADGEMRINPGNPPPADLTVTFENSDCLRNFLLPSPTPKRDFLKKDIMKSLLNHEITVAGNLNLLYKFGYMANHLILHPLP